MQIISLRQDLHKMSSPIFWEQRKAIIYLLSANFIISVLRLTTVNNADINQVVINACTLNKISAEDILKYLAIFSRKTGFDILCKLSPSFGDSLHELSKPIFWEK